MVRAILEGRKTQTRRIVTDKHFKRLGLERDGDFIYTTDGPLWNGEFEGGRVPWCPYGTVGDRLWVRETWARVNSECGPGFAYKADSAFIQPEFDGKNFGAGPSFNYEKYPGDYCMWYSDLVGGADASEGYRWTPSIHMPRWASRITLEITGVRVERLNEISEEDAIAEGVVFGTGKPNECRTCAKGAFMDLWNAINGADSWMENPWVWRIAFKVIKSQSTGA